MNYYFESNKVLLAQSPEWEIKRDKGFAINGIGDCIFRTCLYAISIIDTNNQKAIDLLINCRELLNQRKRWPDELNPLSSVKIRSQKSMTRDPYIMFFIASGILANNHMVWIKNKPIVPWYLYRPYLNNFRKGDYKKFERQLLRTIKFAILTQPLRKYIDRYRILKPLKHKIGIHQYSLHLWSWMAYMADSEKLKDAIFWNIDPSNYLCYVLCDGNNSGFTKLCAEYISREGYQWTEDHILVERNLIPDSDSIRLDKDILDWVIKSRKSWKH